MMVCAVEGAVGDLENEEVREGATSTMHEMFKPIPTPLQLTYTASPRSRPAEFVKLWSNGALGFSHDSQS